MAIGMIVLGASKGGFDALGHLLESLPAGLPVPVAIVLHRGEESGSALATVLSARCPLPVLEPEDKEPARPGRIIIAPGDYHLLVDGEAATPHFAFSTEAPVGFARPSIDLLFESAALVLGPRLLAVVLTGTGRDGAAGAAAVRARGGQVWVQDPASAEEAAMPEAALEAVPGARVVPLADLAGALGDACAQEAEAPK